MILIREISHEPMQRRFDDLVGDIVAGAGELRPRAREGAASSCAGWRARRRSRASIRRAWASWSSASRARAPRSSNWLDVDEALSREDFPDAQLLQDRMRVAMTRWPLPEEMPERVRQLAKRVEEYYESGENPKQRVL